MLWKYSVHCSIPSPIPTPIYAVSYKPYSLQPRYWHLLHSLPNPQIRQDLLRAAQNSIKLIRTMEHFDKLAHARLRDAAAAEYVDGLIGNLVRGACGVGFEEADGTTEVLGLLCVGHV